ncbi:23S rRNA (pseudouridine(1915)-N(3))-methyltransferase RlmH [Methylohalobius crimeensis]|uniref:23S rRNA (pseudouridine(1915)-N(3))-methyltransferase RlmH n=1 Tax=Methylohalobius crimeensis TaxID=244365 RepID=UPI0003B505DE|nr:23S rRNA (pseudouridine(1915)-N(3))-methyltransferase RlmH [Methylohalobius crimeensis]
MRIHLIAVGKRMPAWVQAGYEEYAKRLPKECALHLKEIPLRRRGKNGDTMRQIATEGDQMLTAIPPASHVVALDSRGKQWSTEELGSRLQRWLQLGSDLTLLIGGPEGLAPACLERADDCWSLSRLTFPHPLVRVIVAEQLYRAWSLLQGHPYHR